MFCCFLPPVNQLLRIFPSPLTKDAAVHVLGGSISLLGGTQKPWHSRSKFRIRRSSTQHGATQFIFRRSIACFSLASYTFQVGRLRLAHSTCLRVNCLCGRCRNSGQREG